MEKKNNKGKKIAGIDIGKWIEPEEISLDYEISERTKKYKRYIIAFLDVLGIADLLMIIQEVMNIKQLIK